MAVMDDCVRFRILLPICLFSVFLFSSTASASDSVTLQLKWTHAFQFSGYYAAKELGFYEDAGLDVTILEAAPGVDPVEEITSGRAHYGVGNSSLVIARQKGSPVTVLNVIFQHSPAVFISRGDSAIPSINNLRGKHVMVEPNSTELFAYLGKSGIPSTDITVKEHTYQIDDLIAGRVDAISAYSNYEPYLLNTKGFYFHMFTPREQGIDFYGDNLFTSEAEISNHPERVEAFRKASMRGWDYAMKHQDEMIDVIISKYAPHKDPKHLQFEAQKMNDLLVADLISVGHMNLDRWGRIIETYKSLGYEFEQGFLDGFIYKPYVSVWTRLKEYLWLLVFVSVLMLFLVYRNIQLSIFNKRLSKIANRDQLTGIYNRKYLDEVLTRESQRNLRYGRVYSVIIADVDKFKEVNDEHGHYVGDDVLKDLVTTFQERVRSTDIIGRWGGEEFMFICPETELPDAVNLAESMRSYLEGHSCAGVGKVTASFGVAACKEKEIVSDLVKRADNALYEAKHLGRNHVCSSLT